MNIERNACEVAAGLLPDFWSDQLSLPERAGDRLWLHQHLESCAECASLAGFWSRLEALPAVAPEPGARQRFDQMLAAYAAGLEATSAPALRPGRAAKPGWFAALAFRPLPAMAAAVLLVAGVAAGWFLHRPVAAPAPESANQQIADLRDQVQNTRQLVVLSLLQQQQANDRLQGVMYSSRLQQSDPAVNAALLRSLKYDASPDVRLAALDALSHQAAQPGQAVGEAEVRQGLVEAFHYQKSPLVQIALLDHFVALRDRQARGLLQQVSKDAAYSPEVRQRAQWALAQPAWN